MARKLARREEDADHDTSHEGRRRNKERHPPTRKEIPPVRLDQIPAILMCRHHPNHETKCRREENRNEEADRVFQSRE